MLRRGVVKVARPVSTVLQSGMAARAPLKRAAVAIAQLSVLAQNKNAQLSKKQQVAAKRIGTSLAQAFAQMNLPSAKLHSSPVARSELSQDAISQRIHETAKTLYEKYQTASETQIYHYTQVALAGLAPAALILSPSFLNWPVDLALGVVLPVHLHIGMTHVISDYVPRPFQSLAIIAMYFLSVLTALGLLKINLCGAGITESFKSLWRAPKEKKAEKAVEKPAAAAPAAAAAEAKKH